MSKKILNAGGSDKIQTLLFSATLPPWVKDIQKRFLQPSFQLVDLVGNQKQKVRSPNPGADKVMNPNLNQRPPSVGVFLQPSQPL